MNFSLDPFPLRNRTDRAPDIRVALASRGKESIHNLAISNRALLDIVVDALRDVATPFEIAHCYEANGDLHLSVVAHVAGHNVDVGDEVRAGLYMRNSESCRFDTLACTRLFRVVCENGILVECEKEQSFSVAMDCQPIGWQSQVKQVVAQSFDSDSLRSTFNRLDIFRDIPLLTSYEFLCNLTAQQLITDDEQVDINAKFMDDADFTLYGLINATTQLAHGHRASDQWLRAFQIEQLAGEILRGDHNLPSLDLSPAR